MIRQLIASFVIVSVFGSIGMAQEKPTINAPVGLQLYSLREQFKKDGVEKTLDKVKALNFKYVELAGTYGLPADKFLAMLKERGLEAIGAHFPFGRLKSEPEKVAAEAKALGLKYVGCAWIDHKDPWTEQQVKEAAAVFNKAGKVMADNGMQLYYHNHGYEFVPQPDGSTLFDLLMKETDPKCVFFEMDILWAVFPGQDPAKLLLKYPDRWVLSHLKDLKKGVATGSLKGGTDTRNDVALGTGQVDWNAWFAAANKTAIKYHFIEDESPTVEQQLPVSLKFLESFKK